MISAGYYANTNRTPQQYLYDSIGEGNMRTFFLNSAAGMVNEHDFLTSKQYDNSVVLAQFDDDEPQDNNEVVLELRDEGTTQWFRPEPNKVTTAWSNTLKLSATQSATYYFRFNGDKKGDLGSDSHFGIRLVVNGV